MADEPTSRERRNLFECPGFLEKMRSAGHDLDVSLAAHPRQGSTVQFEHFVIQTAHQQERGGPYLLERGACQIGPAAA